MIQEEYIDKVKNHFNDLFSKEIPENSSNNEIKEKVEDVYKKMENVYYLNERIYVSIADVEKCIKDMKPSNTKNFNKSVIIPIIKNRKKKFFDNNIRPI